MFTTRADGTEGTEVIADSKPCIKVIDGKPWFSFKRNRGGQVKITIEKLKINNSTSITRVLSLMKRSTCKEDKLYLKEVDQILKEKVMLEKVNDTKRVQGFPKRITVFMFSKKTSLEFEGVKSINSTAYLSEMLKKLEVPPPVNTLEVEARDLVKARLDLVTEELKQLHEEESEEEERSLQTTSKQKTIEYMFRLKEQKLCTCLNCRNLEMYIFNPECIQYYLLS